MAAFYDDSAKNAMLDHLATLVTRVALHTGDPGGANSATNEVSGGDYARTAIAFGSASAGAISPSADVDISVPGATTVIWVSLWNTAGAVRYAKKQVTSEAFGEDGTYRVKTDSAFDLNNDPA